MNTIQKKILVVDDQDNWRKMLQKLLEQEGYFVQTVSSYDHAQEKIYEGLYDLLVLDLRLVDEDIFNIQGLELLKIAKSTQTNPHIIILSGYPESIRDETKKMLGIDAVMPKVPLGGRFNIQDFKEKIQSLLSQSIRRN